MPALATTTSSRPKCPTAASTAALTCAESVTSVTLQAAASPSSAAPARRAGSDSPASNTRAPSAMKARAVAIPIEPSPPVIIAALPTSRPMARHATRVLSDGYGWRSAWCRVGVTGRHASSLAGRHLRRIRDLGGSGRGVQHRLRAPALGRGGGLRVRARADRDPRGQERARVGRGARPLVRRGTAGAARLDGGPGPGAARGMGGGPIRVDADPPGHAVCERGRAGGDPEPERLQPVPAGDGPVRAAPRAVRRRPADRPEDLVRRRLPGRVLAGAPSGRRQRPWSLGDPGRGQPGDRLRARPRRYRRADGRVSLPRVRPALPPSDLGPPRGPGGRGAGGRL